MKKQNKPKEKTVWDTLDEWEKQAQLDRRFPSVPELAQLVARLVIGREMPKTMEEWRPIADSAQTLWDACHDSLRDALDDITVDATMDYPFSQFLKTVTMPKKFPINLDEFLRLALPNKTAPDRMRLWRSYARGNGFGPPLTDKELEELIVRQRKEMTEFHCSIDDSMFHGESEELRYARTVWDFLDHVRRLEKAARKEKSSKAARARHAKKK